ncbi:Activator of osmoprotectant transporter ProP [Candidatus Burkholderia verschuerenii]|uniref:Activator of osmoprotectant transporter ProP n=1 Tax=Candidatus Burkholderia verschuerenii TaxID=242163 RepID=A0A0L0MB51_9BURK|nr:ProQ/FinO family protein [Candidatus Burkholderia verschuerenii]KND59500.1 Activator of osmoprotectant transporter ProP [Candidatus Burkholderia verschuerenii]
MGFEQLAALKSQLAAQAKRDRAQHEKAKPEKATHAKAKAQTKAPDDQARKAARPDRPQRPPRPQRPANEPAQPPVDPVVHTIGKLQKKFPLAFPKNPAPKLPLKVGILEELLTHAADLRLTERELRDAIAVWCRGNRYRACLVQGAARVDLLGQPAGEVSAGEAAHARRSGSKRPAQPKAEASPQAEPTTTTTATTTAPATPTTPDDTATPPA